MKIPDFIPIHANEKRKREFFGLLLEVFIWAYLAVVLVRILFFSIFMRFVEDLSLDEPKNILASKIVSWFDFDSRYYEMSWNSMATVALVGMFIGLLVGLSSRGFGLFLLSHSKLRPISEDAVLQTQRHWKYAKIEGAVVLLATCATGWVLAKIDLGKAMESQGIQGAMRLILQLSCGLPGFGEKVVKIAGVELFTLPFSLFEILRYVLNAGVSLINLVGSFANSTPLELLVSECTPTPLNYYGNAIKLLGESLFLAFMATLFSVPVAFILAFFAASNLTRHSKLMRLVYTFVRTYINVSRSVEPLIWAIVLAVWVGIGPFAGSLALMVHSISSLVKQYSEAIECVDEGPLEAITATGANRIAVAWYGVVPQVLLPYLSFTIYRWDINVRMSTIIGLVGGGGIGSLLIQEQGLANWTQVGTIAFLIFLVVWSMDFMSAKVRAAIQ